MKPSVSIIIPCFNAARWLQETLDSALGQTWAEKEVILVDDGSTDDSLAVARRFASRGIRIVSQRKAGAAAARNTGLRHARGEYLQFLDADDLLSPRKVELQLQVLAHRPTGTLATCRWGRFETDPARARFVDAAVFRDFSSVEFLVLAGESGAMMHPSAWLVPRQVAEAAGPWDETLTLNDDGEYFCRVALASAGLAFCADPAARSYYRSGIPGSLSRRRDAAARRSQFRALELITSRILQFESSPRTRRAVAGYWRRFVHDFFPFPADLIERALGELTRLGEPVGRPALGPKASLAARVIGWRNLRRLQWRLGL